MNKTANIYMSYNNFLIYGTGMSYHGKGMYTLGGYCGCRGDCWQIIDVHELGMWDIRLQYIVWQLSMKLTII